MLPLDLTNDINLESPYQPHSSFFDKGCFLFYGFQIKNRYDEQRLLIDESLTPVRINHNLSKRNFYGVIVQGNHLLQNLEKHLLFNLDEKQYKLLFEQFNINIHNSYELFAQGVFPFDNLSDLSYTEIDANKFFCNNKIPFYQRISGLTPYIFVDKN